MKTKKIQHKNSGFSLVETLVALSIFTFSILALVSTSTSSLTSLNYARNRVVANYLAQEGIEAIRNVRDSAVILDPALGWTNFESAIDDCTNAGGCNIDTLVNSNNPGTSGGIEPCVGETSCTLYQNTTTGYLGTSGGDPTNFRRRIEMKSINSGGGIREYQVTSTVSWQDSGTSRSISLVEYIYDWQ